MAERNSHDEACKRAISGVTQAMIDQMNQALALDNEAFLRRAPEADSGDE